MQVVPPRSKAGVFRRKTASNGVWQSRLNGHKVSAKRLKNPPEKNGGDERIRTADPLLARQVLSQLSYTPIHKYA